MTSSSLIRQYSPGELCYSTSSGTWVAADADATGTAGGVLPAIALALIPMQMLLRGMFTLTVLTIMDELYRPTTAGGWHHCAPPGRDVVRVVYYCRWHQWLDWFDLLTTPSNLAEAFIKKQTVVLKWQDNAKTTKRRPSRRRPIIPPPTSS